MLLHRFSQVLSLLAVSALCPTAHAALVITEVMSSSGHPGGPANGDWFELHNSGASTLDLTGYYWDDDGMFGNDGALFPLAQLECRRNRCDCHRVTGDRDGGSRNRLRWLSWA